MRDSPELSLIPLQVDSKVTLGLGGVAVVLGAVMAAMGFFSYLGVPSSLVILQVVPFLVLAVGADNIFIFVLEYQVRGRGAPAAPGARPTLFVRGQTRAHRPQTVPCHLCDALSPALTLPRAAMPSVGHHVAPHSLPRGMPRMGSPS